MKIVVIGVGHVGLVTAGAMAHFGHQVVGLDDDPSKIDTLLQGKMPFFEPDMEELVHEGLASGSLSFTRDYGSAMDRAEVAFICVGTPPRADGDANLTAVEGAARQAVASATGPIVLVQKSTVPVRTAGRLARMLGHTPHHGVHLASNPEFLREGHAVHDSLEPDRILVGADDEVAHETIREVYRSLIDSGVRYFATDIASAELAKHACNAFLAAKISFANGLARVCELAGADVVAIADIMGADPRIGREFLDAGLGFGGYCLPKDVAAFRTTAAKLGYEFGLLEEILKINEQAMTATFDRLLDALWNLEDKKIVLAGLAFKAGTDDVRESPSLRLAARLMEAGASVIGHDPHANPAAQAELPDLAVSEDLYQACEGADCLVISTRSPEFAALDLPRLKSALNRPLIVDTANLLDPQTVGEAGFTYVSIGRPPVNL
jgi:UDPglucose 6-dehydrogenase